MSLAQRLQPAILEAPPPIARSLTFRIDQPEAVRDALARFAGDFSCGWGVAGFGEPCALAMSARIPGLKTFPALSGAGCAVPSSQGALWVRLCGADRGVVFDSARRVRKLLAGGFRVAHTLDTFTYHGGRDLTRFEDGTENPRDENAVRAAAVAEGPLAGSSFVAVQQWVHDLDRFEARSESERDHLIGRSARTNEELDDAPAFAHVKRTAQESFDPPAFMVRRSMPWAGVSEEGLEFVAFVASLETFDRVMRRMAGCEDGIVDGLFSFSRPVNGAFYWCPPATGDHLDMGALLHAR